MSLNIGGSATLKTYAKFNAKADKWFVRRPEGEDVEIARPSFVVDFDNIATGWLCFREGQAPERVMDQGLERAAPCPGEGFKRGFVVQNGTLDVRSNAESVGGRTPSPMKLSPAAFSTAQPRFSDTCTVSGGSAFGRMCRPRMRAWPPPRWAMA